MPRKPTKKPTVDTSNLYQRRAGGTWWCRVQVGGEDRRVSLRTADVVTAAAERDRLIAEAQDDRAGRVRPVVRRWQDAVDGWLGELEGRVAARALSPTTAARYQTSVRGWGHLHDVPLLDIRTGVITRFVSKRQSDGATPQTIKNDLTSLSSVLQWAVLAGWLESNPARFYDRKRLGGASRKLNPPRDNVLHEIIEAVETTWSPEVARLMMWLRSTGMRAGEALAVHREDILPDGTLRIHRAVKLDKDGEKSRVIHLGRAAELLPSLPKKGRLFPGLVESSRQLASHYGQWRRQRQAREDREAKRGMRMRTILPTFNLHLLRHAFGIASLIDDPDCLYRLRNHLGHASVSITERYVDYLRKSGADRVHARRRDLFGSLSDTAEGAQERRRA